MAADKRYIDEAKGRIDAAALVDALERHALGEIKMTSTQVSAALALLKKIMPDLSTAKEKPIGEEEELSFEEALSELE